MKHAKTANSFCILGLLRPSFCLVVLIDQNKSLYIGKSRRRSICIYIFLIMIFFIEASLKTLAPIRITNCNIEAVLRPFLASKLVKLLVC